MDTVSPMRISLGISGFGAGTGAGVGAGAGAGSAQPLKIKPLTSAIDNRIRKSLFTITFLLSFP